METSSTLTSSLLRDDAGLLHIRAFLERLPHKPMTGDFEEQVQLPEVQKTVRLWQHDNELAAFAYVDNSNNLWFAAAPDPISASLENEILEWGLACMRQRNAETGEPHTLDASCRADDAERLRFLERFGFVRESVRSLAYSRSLAEPIEDHPLPPSFTIRSVTGEDEVDELVALHHAAFGTDNMTVEERLAIMRAPQYVPELDLVVVASNGDMAAFCICGFDEEKVGYTDPIGTHPRFQKIGLGKAIVSAGLRALQERGAAVAELGTSSANLPMQKLAERMGFVCIAESLWFSKAV